jgi:hypothetical protein
LVVGWALRKVVTLVVRFILRIFVSDIASLIYLDVDPLQTQLVRAVRGVQVSAWVVIHSRSLSESFPIRVADTVPALFCLPPVLWMIISLFSASCVFEVMDRDHIITSAFAVNTPVPNSIETHRILSETKHADGGARHGMLCLRTECQECAVKDSAHGNIRRCYKFVSVSLVLFPWPQQRRPTSRTRVGRPANFWGPLFHKAFKICVHFYHFLPPLGSVLMCALSVVLNDKSVICHCS